MDNMEDMMHLILKSREDRVILQRHLVESFQSSLVSFTLNIPGPEKDHENYRKVHQEGMNSLIELFTNRKCPILYKDTMYKPTGPEGFICVEMDAVKLKELTIHLEDTHGLGRLFDMDVFDNTRRSISRKDLGYNERKCLLCENTATFCRRGSKHTLEELLASINFKITRYFQNFKNN